MYKKVNRVPDTKKETAVFFVDRTLSVWFYMFGFADKLKEYFDKDYNVVFIGNESKENLGQYKNFYNFDKEKYEYLKLNKMKRKKEYDDNSQFNNQLLMNEMTVLDDIKNIKYVFILNHTPFILPLQQYGPGDYFKKMLNEFHDYIGNDPNMLKFIEETNLQIGTKLDTRLSALAFTQYHKLTYLLTFKYLYEKHKDTIESFYGFIIDPIFYHPWFKVNNIPFQAFYFEDDKRGNREFIKFPLAHLQHLVYDKQFKKEPVKEKDFIFAGTILHEKGSRANTWYNFFNDLDLDNSSLYIPPIKNGVISDKTTNILGKTKKAKNSLSALFNDIYEHKNYEGYLLPGEVAKVTRKHKYGMVLRCVSTYDSLNFRPVFYLNHNVLPFFDEQYDPAFLQVPKHFQDKLIVKNHSDIERLVKYYNDHDEERISLLNELKEFFKIEYFKTHWELELDAIFK